MDFVVIFNRTSKKEVKNYFNNFKTLLSWGNFLFPECLQDIIVEMCMYFIFPIVDQY